jgi:DNA-binding transcriptional ArsR family regulator
MLTELQQSIQDKYPQITFNHEECLAILKEDKHTEELQEELFSAGYLLSGDSEDSHFTYRWLTNNVGNEAFPLMLKFSSFRKDKRESLLRLLAFVFFFSCQCGTKHTCRIWMSQAFLSKRTGLDKRTIGRTIKSLQELGIITCIRHGNSITKKASSYAVSPEVFATAFFSVDLCNIHLRWVAREYRNCVAVSPDNTIHCYGDINKARVQALFPTQPTHGCKVKWYDKCYGRTFFTSSVVADGEKDNGDNGSVKMSSYPSLHSMGGHFSDSPSVGEPTGGIECGVLTEATPIAVDKAKEAICCALVYEHSLDFSNLVIGPKISFLARSFESSA